MHIHFDYLKLLADYYPEGSGGDRINDRCNPENTDDEDCYDYNSDYEHSGYEGSGDGNDDTEFMPEHGDRGQTNTIHHGGNARGQDSQVIQNTFSNQSL